jgi:CubicO group peptidase (beta-lactamase class C family)
MYDFNKEADSGFVNGYGYKWWITGGTGYYMYSARGYGGQSINVIPELDLVVVFTAVPDAPVPLTNEACIEAIKQFIIPAVSS